MAADAVDAETARGGEELANHLANAAIVEPSVVENMEEYLFESPAEDYVVRCRSCGFNKKELVFGSVIDRALC